MTDSDDKFSVHVGLKFALGEIVHVVEWKYDWKFKAESNDCHFKWKLNEKRAKVVGFRFLLNTNVEYIFCYEQNGKFPQDDLIDSGMFPAETTGSGVKIFRTGWMAERFLEEKKDQP